MTLIDKAEVQSAVRAYLVHESTEIALHVEQIIAALPARGVGEAYEAGLQTALGLIASIGYGKNEDVDRGHEEAFGAVARHLQDLRDAKAAALAPTDAAHVNETPKSEHDGADVLTAAQAREAAARLLLDMLYMRNGAHEGVSKEDAQKMWDAASTREGYAAVDAFLRSIIGETRT